MYSCKTCLLTMSLYLYYETLLHMGIFFLSTFEQSLPFLSCVSTFACCCIQFILHTESVQCVRFIVITESTYYIVIYRKKDELSCSLALLPKYFVCASHKAKYISRLLPTMQWENIELTLNRPCIGLIITRVTYKRQVYIWLIA